MAAAQPAASALMAAELANDNRASLTATLGREPDAAELYVAHFLGAEGAGRFLTALAADPGQSAAALLPKPAAANRTVFFVGENPTTSMPTLVNAKYNVVGVNKYNPGTGAGITSGVVNASYASGSGSMSGTVGSINFAGTAISSNGSFARADGSIKGQFYGSSAQAMAGIYNTGNAATSVAFGGAKQ